MCGIAGWIGPSLNIALLEKMTTMMAHRGPDGFGHAVSDLKQGGSVALGHRRLSIVDVAHGHQPMSSHDNRYIITFNGEIYNYPEIREKLEAKGVCFRTNSDTEVLVEAWRQWGVAALKLLRGMFAFGLYDKVEQSLVIARDPYGKKPLYYASKQRGECRDLYFSSEIRALLAVPQISNELDTASIYEYLMWRYVPGPDSLFENIKKLPPGCFMVWKNGTLTTSRYWLAPYEEDNYEKDIQKTLSPSAAIDGFRNIFEESVKIRLQADVPVGAFLSSGLDSSSVVAMAQKIQGTPINTYSIGFDGDQNSETPAARESAAFFGSNHHDVTFNKEDLLEWIPKLTLLRGAPLSEPADVALYFLSKAASRDVKVVLSGEGSDELFGGYPKHWVENSFLTKVPSGFYHTLFKGISAFNTSKGNMARLRIFLKSLASSDDQERMINWFGGLTSAERTDIWIASPISRDLDKRPFTTAKWISPLQKCLHFDQVSWLPDNLLDRMDTMTMAASVEGRAPFMDTKLARFAQQLPDNMRISGGVSKKILRDAMAPMLPAHVLERQKIGFRIPTAKWLREDISESFNDLVLSEGSRVCEYISQQKLRRIYDDHCQHKCDNSKFLWSIYALEIAIRQLA